MKQYINLFQRRIFALHNLTVETWPVEDLIVADSSTPEDSGNHCEGVLTSHGKVPASCVIICTGTFLKGALFCGQNKKPGGRVNESPTYGLSETLNRLGFQLGRLKTGTPPRLYKDSIDFSKCSKILPDCNPLSFSFINEKVSIPPENQICSYITQTTETTRKIVEQNMKNSLLLVEQDSTGPRFCPSLEAKFTRFKLQHFQVFLDSEGLDSNIVYPSGISVTIPEEAQVC